MDLHFQIYLRYFSNKFTSFVLFINNILRVVNNVFHNFIQTAITIMRQRIAIDKKKILAPNATQKKFKKKKGSNNI